MSEKDAVTNVENKKAETEKIESQGNMGEVDFAEFRRLTSATKQSDVQLPGLILTTEKDKAPEATPPSTFGYHQDRLYFGSIPEYAGFGGLLLMRHSMKASSGLMAAGGAYQAYRDIGHLQKADGFLSQSKYGAALVADGSMVAGGVLALAKVGGPRLGAGLMLGGFAGRLLLDLVPEKKK